MKREVYALSPNSTVVEAMEMFSEKGISGAPVVDENHYVVGFLSDGDIMACLADQVPAFKTSYSFIVERENSDFDASLRQIMAQPVHTIATKRVISVNVDDDLGEVARVLFEHRLKKAPVLSDGAMVGIINRSNITRYAIERYHADEAAEK